MIVRRAKIKDLDRINKLLKKYDLASVDSNYVNSKDISILVEDRKEVVGFVWCGLMANGTYGYIDYFTIDPDRGKQKIADRLGQQLDKILKHKKVKLVMGHILNTQYAKKAYENAKKIDLELFPVSANIVYKQLEVR